MTKEQIMDKALKLGAEYGLKLVMAVVIWIVGSWIIKRLNKIVANGMAKSNYEDSLQKFLLNLVSWTLKILLIIVILGQVGIETTSFAAILAAAGLAVGMALQGSLANFAGGVLLLIFKPFKIGDLIESQGELGVVKEIEIFTTKLKSLDNKEVILPNGVLSNGTIKNYSTEEFRRVDLVFGVGYDADLKETKDVLLNVLANNPMVVNDPKPQVEVFELADSSVNFVVRPWCKNADYWDVYFNTVEMSKIALDKAGIEIPYPHSVEIQK